MIPEESDHRCRVGRHCSAGTPDGAAITMQPNTICHTCVRKLQYQLDQLPDVRKALRLNVKRSLVPQGGGAKVASSPTAAVPLNLHALDVLNDLDQVLEQARGYTIANLIRQPAEMSRLWISGVLKVGYIDGVDKALAVGIVWRKADSIIGISILWEQRHAPCPKCELRTLRSFAGTDYISCSDCGATLTREEYGALCVKESKKRNK